MILPKTEGAQGCASFAVRGTRFIHGVWRKALRAVCVRRLPFLPRESFGYLPLTDTGSSLKECPDAEAVYTAGEVYGQYFADCGEKTRKPGFYGVFALFKKERIFSTNSGF